MQGRWLIGAFVLILAAVSAGLPPPVVQAQPSEEIRPAPEPSGGARPSHPELDQTADHRPAEYGYLDEARAYGSHRAVDVETARRALAIESLLPTYADRLTETFGEQYGGIWVNERLLGEIHVALVAPSSEDVSRAQGLFEYPFLVEVVDHPHSLRTLNALASRMEAIRASHGISAYYVDESANAVAIGMPSPTREAVARVRAELGDDAPLYFFEHSGELVDFDIPTVGANCRNSSRAHCNPLRGGLVLHTESAAATTVSCTMGFTARDAVYTTHRFVLTAGHCASGVRFHSDSNVGAASLAVNSGNSDSRRIAVANAWSIINRIYVLPGNEQSGITSVYYGNNLAQGTGICGSGAVTGWVCGGVVRGNYSASGYTNMIWYNMCFTNNDSGGPLVISNQAIGLIKGAHETPACGNNWGSYVSNAESRLSVRVLTS